MRISDWSSDVCSSDLAANRLVGADGALVPVDPDIARGDRGRQIVAGFTADIDIRLQQHALRIGWHAAAQCFEMPMSLCTAEPVERSEEHTSELQSLMRISYAVFCLKKKKITPHNTYRRTYHQNR